MVDSDDALLSVYKLALHKQILAMHSISSNAPLQKHK